jgi:hypothetical protein
VQGHAARAGVPLVELGRTTAAGLVIRNRAGGDLVRVELGALRAARERCLVAIVGE